MKPDLSSFSDALCTAWNGVGESFTKETKSFAAFGPLEDFMIAIEVVVDKDRLPVRPNLNLRMAVRSRGIFGVHHRAGWVNIDIGK